MKMTAIVVGALLSLPAAAFAGENHDLIQAMRSLEKAVAVSRGVIARNIAASCVADGYSAHDADSCCSRAADAQPDSDEFVTCRAPRHSDYGGARCIADGYAAHSSDACCSKNAEAISGTDEFVSCEAASPSSADAGRARSRGPQCISRGFSAHDASSCCSGSVQGRSGDEFVTCL